MRGEPPDNPCMTLAGGATAGAGGSGCKRDEAMALANSADFKSIIAPRTRTQPN